VVTGIHIRRIGVSFLSECKVDTQGKKLVHRQGVFQGTFD